ncbi:hypothetical protein [Dactylosporangium sp. CA-139066]|uniref:hypothetical protein n=1 Tax=Dactylosporangium sp. CA-139066 TaxID=3239930 RepID=UPI003D8CD4ED
MSELELAPPEIAPEQPRPKVIAITLAAIGFGLALAAQYLPWASLNLDAAGRLTDGEDAGAAAKTVDMPVAYFNVAHMTVYLLTLGFGLAALAMVLFAPAAVRRAATGAGIGLFAGNLIALVGLKGVIDHVGSTSLAALNLDSDMVKSGSGYYLAYAAVLVLAAALVLAAWSPSAVVRMRRRTEEPEGGEPLELTVTPVPPPFQ